ncbi:MAG: DNA topoisomerase (ATP-hydrolyzing) subunit B [Candidatus Babeliales bacterium]
MSIMTKDSKNTTYGAKAIQVIEGLEAVRKRPAMYIGSVGPGGLHHLVYEIVDNSVDEALAGHCTKIDVALNTDGSCSVEDNGRGIPTDIHPTEGVSAAEVVLTKLHAGGKFDKESYKFSGGLHGVGVSVVNALSRRLELEIYRDGNIYSQVFERGKPLAPLSIVGTTKKQGTFIRFFPDSEIFTETVQFNFETLSARLRELAFLNKKLTINITDEITDKKHEFYFEGGIVSFVEHINAKKKALFPDVIHIEHETESYILEIAMQYNDGYNEQLYSFVNNINTIEGGTHVSGFKTALTKICNKKAIQFNIIKSGEAFSSDDVREGLVCVISIKVPEPQFEGQTKTKLGNSDVKGLVDSWTFAALDTYFEENPAIAKLILQKAELAKRARDAAKKARDLTRRKTALEGMVLPGKLADCSEENPEKTEMFIVEGDSAGGSAKQGRDRFIQAILPLRGKILNVEKARLDRMLSNEEIKALISAIGCGIGEEEFDVSKARYHKIILMTDADVDGSHIRTLLLTFFFRYMKPVIEKGYLYIAQPPLYKIKIGKKEQYLKDETSFTDFLYDWAQEQTLLTIKSKEIPGNDWVELLNNLKIFENRLKAIAQSYRVAYENLYKAVLFARSHPWKKENGTESLLKNLKSYFKEYNIRIEEGKPFETAISDSTEKDELTTVQPPYVVFQQITRAWKIEVDFFDSKDLAVLLQLVEDINSLEDNAWTLHIVGKERAITDQGIMRLIKAIGDISKPFMTIQRYKGLGEMNPEQLWETSMDPNTRNLLKVTIEDALEADSWFSTLMGDDVEGRRKYIEQNGQFVKNLDI